MPHPLPPEPAPEPALPPRRPPSPLAVNGLVVTATAPKVPSAGADAARPRGAAVETEPGNNFNK